MPPVLEPVDFQNDVMVVRGSSVVLPCEAQGSPLPLVSWMKDGEPLLPQSLEQGPSLQLETVGAGDSGTYSCVAVSEAGEAKRHFQLTVMGESSAHKASLSGPGCRVGLGWGADGEGWGGGESLGGSPQGLTPGYGLWGQGSLIQDAALAVEGLRGPSFSWGHALQLCPSSQDKEPLKSRGRALSIKHEILQIFVPYWKELCQLSPPASPPAIQCACWF